MGNSLFSFFHTHKKINWSLIWRNNDNFAETVPSLSSESPSAPGESLLESGKIFFFFWFIFTSSRLKPVAMLGPGNILWTKSMANYPAGGVLHSLNYSRKWWNLTRASPECPDMTGLSGWLWLIFRQFFLYHFYNHKTIREPLRGLGMGPQRFGPFHSTVAMLYETDSCKKLTLQRNIQPHICI